MRTWVLRHRAGGARRGRNRPRERGIGTKQPHAAPGAPPLPARTRKAAPWRRRSVIGNHAAGLAARHAARGRHQDPGSKRRWTRSWKSVAAVQRLRADAAVNVYFSNFTRDSPSFDIFLFLVERENAAAPASLRHQGHAAAMLCIQAPRRYSVGVRPACLRKAVANELASPKPRPSPICVTAKSGVADKF